jgi:Ca2+-binding EF-hand superfamily protein
MSDLRAFLLGAAVICGMAAGSAMAGKAQDAIARFDKDNDKTLDLAEVKAAASNHFAQLDKNADGTLDATELKGVMGAAKLKEADADHDGTLTKEEYLSFTEKLFKSADPDHEGTVDAAELGAPAGHRLLAMLGGTGAHSA